MNSDARGKWAEIFAKGFLFFKGYQLLHHRYKSPFGEIDIIARRGKTLVAVEVKYRQSLDKAKESISRRQQERIARALSQYRGKLSWQPQTLRFDVICMAPWGRLEHIKNAWDTPVF